MAEDNINRNIEEEKEFLALQKQISQAAKEAGKSWRNMGDYTKVVASNYLEMQKISKRMKEIQKEINNASEERAAILRQELATLEKEREQLKSINKELTSITNVAKIGLQGVLTYLGNAITGYLDFSQKVRDASAQIGLGASNMNMMQSNIEQSSIQMQRYGVGVQEAVEAQQAYSDELGRSVILSQKAFENMAMIGKATGLGMKGMAELSAQMEIFGLGAESSSSLIMSMYSESAAMGLNSGNVIKKFQQNLGLLNKLNFKAGVKGLQKMSQLSEKFKIDMNDAAASAEKAFKLEEAVDMAAKLQVLGGSMAALGDPFQLMYKARNNPEKFAEDIANAASQSAVFNKESGEFEVSAYEMDRLRLAAEATGQSMEGLVGQAKQTAKINMFKGLLGGKGLSPEEQDAVAMMSQMVDGKAQIQIGVGKDGKAMMKDLTAVGKDDLQNILNDKKSAEDAASQATGIMERLQNFLNQLLVAVYPLFHSLEQNLQPLIDMLTQKTTGWAESLKNFFTTMDISGWIESIKGFFVGLWEKLKFIAEHWKLALGIAATAFVAYWIGSQVIAGGIFGRIAGAAFRMSSGVGGGAGGVMSGGGKGPAPANPGSVTGGSNPASMIKSAASILILSAALFVFAKALQEFDKLKDGWGTLGLAAGGMIILAGGLWAISSIPSNNVIQGALAIGILGVALIPFAYAMSLMSGVSWSTLGAAAVGLVVFTAAAFGLGALLMGPGAIIFGAGILGFLALGGAMMVLGLGLSVVVGPLGQFMATIGDGTALLNAGLGFLSMAAGIGVLTLSLIALGAASLLALPGLLLLGVTTSMLTETASAIASSGGGEGIKTTVESINNLDVEKLEALKDLATWMALIGASPTIKFDESLTIDGNIQISGQAGGKSNTEWVSDPIFVDKLKQLIAESSTSAKNGNKA